METLIYPEIFGNKVKAFFTGKVPGTDPGQLARIASTGKMNIYLPIQKHTDKVIILDSSLDPKIGDAVITNQKGILVGVQTADCVPILLYDRASGVAGAVHAGWRGTGTELLRKSIRAMMDRYHSSPAELLVAIGPSIRGCCYHVGYEVIEAMKGTAGKGEYVVNRGGKYFLDLATANRYQALSIGVPPENIWMSDECTFCLPEKYYSYRFAKGPTGRQGGFIGILP
jgi:YfiH family protein